MNRRWSALLGLGLAGIVLPRLGAAGLWEPGELGLGEQARTTVVDRRAILPALGLSLFGEGRAAARLPGALCALATLAVTAWAGAGLFSRRAGVLAAVVLGTSPMFVLGARQLTTDGPLWLAGALALGGLGRFVAGTRSRVDFAVGLLGLALGAWAGGALLGIVAPVLAVSVAALLHRERRPLAMALGAVAGGIMVLALAMPARAGEPSWWLGAAPRVGPTVTTFVELVRRLGFGLFPWSPLAFFAVARALGRPDEGGRRALAGTVLLLASAFGFALGSWHGVLTGEVRFPALVALALAVAALLDDAYEGLRAPLLAFLSAVGVFLLARDIGHSPEELVSVLLPTAVSWPTVLALGVWVWPVVVLFAAGVTVSLVRPPWPRVVRAALPVALGAALVGALLLAHLLVPTLSRHLSLDLLMDRHRALGGQTLGLYRVPRRSLGPHAGPVREVNALPELVALLRETPRAHALVPREELAMLDERFASAGVRYAVADARSSRHLLLVRELPAGMEDQNPLRRHVWRAVFGGQPDWAAPTRSADTVFGDAIALVGADFPAAVRRPGRFKLRLHLHVRQRPPPGYKIFVHLSLPGHPNVNGDHPPLGGAFPTAQWLPGDRIIDEHEIDLPFMTTVPGRYGLYVGFWPGGASHRPLPITSGADDGTHRAPLGTVHIR